MFPYLNALASIRLKFQLELLRLSGLALETILVKSHLMKIHVALESPEKLSDRDLDGTEKVCRYMYCI